MPDLRGYLPLELDQVGERLFLRWLYVGERQLTVPFLKHELPKLAHADTRQLLTPLEAVSAVPETEPKAFIFHHARCGSTLLLRLLVAGSGWDGIGEPPVINRLLLADLDEERKRLALRGLVNALSSRGGAVDRPAIFKFSGWNLLFQHYLREAFPHTPVLNVFRDPRVAIDSLRLRPSGWSRNLPAWVKGSLLADQISEDLDADRRIGMILAAWLRAELPEVGGPARLIHYPEIDKAAQALVRAWLGDAWSADRERAMRACRDQDAHRPDRRFDDRRTQPQITPEALALHRQYTAEPYERLLAAAAQQPDF